MEEKIILNFFEEEISVPIQKNLIAIREIISSKYLFSPEDAKEIILYYIKENKKIIIQKEEDYTSFLQEKLKKIFLDISQESKIYQENLAKLKNKEIKIELEGLYKKRNEINSLKEKKRNELLEQQMEIKEQIKKLKLKNKEIKKNYNKELKKIKEENKLNENKINELEEKLGVKNKDNNVSLKNFPINEKLNQKISKGKPKNMKLKDNKKKLIQDLDKIIQEKKQEFENYLNSIKQNLTNTNINKEDNNFNKTNNNKIILKAKNEKLKSPLNKMKNLLEIDSDNPFGFDCYINRELSWLNFNVRVLNEAKDPSIPILERLKFCAITTSNMDEFFMVRVAALQNSVDSKEITLDIAGLTQIEQLKKIKASVRDIHTMQYSTYNRSLKKELFNIGIELIDNYENLNEIQKIFVDDYFDKNVAPVLTPIAVDKSSPFPLIYGKSINIALLLKRKINDYNKNLYNYQEILFGNVEVPSILKRIIEIPNTSESKISYILLETIIVHNLYKIFTNFEIISVHTVRVMRNSEYPLDERDVETLLDQIEEGIKNRQFGDVLRLEVDDEIDNRLLNILKNNLEVKDEDIFRLQGPLDMTFLFGLYDMIPEEFNNYKAAPFTPQINPRLGPNTNIFEEISKKDIFLFHPYETFDPILDFVKQGAEDPNVLAIKQTLYRISGNSPLVHSLIKAGQKGKQVVILLELKARFDEENNIKWAKELKKVGCKVVYGVKGLKTHCKITMVVRKENEKIKRYCHFGTGNYNDKTAKLYTDCGILTCRDDYGEDAANVFNMITGEIEPNNWNKLLLAPLWMKRQFITLIEREAEYAKMGKKAIIYAKMNALVDKMMIDALLKASQDGVKIHLIVRGICCLKVGVPGVSENIKVESIVGTFLEHNRLYYFYNDGNEEYYMGSADWMPRNLDKRVEIIIPVEDEEIKEKVRHVLDVYIADNEKAYYMQPNGTYKKLNTKGQKLVNSQMQFCEEAIEAAKKI